jgi:hypothetical protein
MPESRCRDGDGTGARPSPEKEYRVKNIGTAEAKVFLGAATLLLLTSGAQASTRHPAARAEREETRALNAQQLQQAEQQNAGLSINAHPVATDAAVNLANNAPPAAAPTMPVEQANNLPQAMPAEPSAAPAP